MMCYTEGMKATANYYALRWTVLNRDHFTCQYCGQRAPDVILHVDHIIPVSRGGKYTEDNLVTCCWACNIGKGAALTIPRQDNTLPRLSPKHIPLAELIKDYIAQSGPSCATDIAKAIKRNRVNVVETLIESKSFLRAGREGRKVLYTLSVPT